MVANVLDPNQGRGGHSLGFMSAFAMLVEYCLLVNLNMLVSWAWEKEQRKVGEECVLPTMQRRQSWHEPSFGAPVII